MMVESRKLLILFSFVSLTVPFVLISHEASRIISHIEQEVTQISAIEMAVIE